MKIIKKGYQKCSRCNCEFEFDKKDLRLNWTYFANNPYYYVECPCCLHKIKITMKN